jgi:hypothetical protein
LIELPLPIVVGDLFTFSLIEVGMPRERILELVAADFSAEPRLPDATEADFAQWVDACRETLDPETFATLVSAGITWNEVREKAFSIQRSHVDKWKPIIATREVWNLAFAGGEMIRLDPVTAKVSRSTADVRCAGR